MMHIFKKDKSPIKNHKNYDNPVFRCGGREFDDKVCKID